MHSCCCGGDCGEGTTYSDCGKDILELVDEGNKPGVIDIDATEAVVSIQGRRLLPRGAAGIGRSTHAVGLAFAMAGEEVQLCCSGRVCLLYMVYRYRACRYMCGVVVGEVCDRC
jgi:hypothetical protein